MSGERGFTLIEVLIAVIVTALLLTSVYGVFATVDGARRRVEADAGHYHLARVIFDRLGRELHGVYWSSAAGAHAVFRGGKTDEGQPYLELSTTTATPQSGGGGIVIVRYETRPDPDHAGQLQLLRSERPAFTAAFQSSQTLQLAAGIAGLQLRFFSGGSWHDKWDASTGGLPQLVEVKIDEAAGGDSLPFVTSFSLASAGGGT